MTDKLEALRRKIRGLLNMTSANGCTEDEAETALRMAASLMLRHGIEQDSLGVTKEVLAGVSRVTQRIRKHQIFLATAAAQLYGCRVLTYAGGKEGIEFIGRDDNRDAAEHTMFWLIRQVDLLYKAHLPKGLSQRERSEYRRSFKEHCAARVYSRAAALVREMMTQDMQESTGSTALVVAHHFEKLAQENQVLVNQRASKKKRRGQSIKWGSGAGEGTSAGDQVQLRTEIK